MKAGREKIEVKVVLLCILIMSVLLISLSFTSANSAGASIGGPRTLVTGVVHYPDSIENTVPGAKVIVTCEDKNHIRRTMTQETTSGEDGEYFVLFDSQLECGKKDRVTVNAIKGEQTGTNTGKVDKDGEVKKLNVAFVDVPLVPEFGVVAGITTVLGAVGTFFFIRKKHHVRVKKK